MSEPNSNKWVNWIECAIEHEYIKCYDYEKFNNIERIGSGGFGKVYRAKWKSSYLALKSFFNFDNTTLKAIVKEIKLQRRVDYHENILRFCGISTKSQSEDSKEYLLVMEYADSGTLRNYLSERFNDLTWNDKLNLTLQLTCAVSCLHDEEIVHNDLNSNNILIHRNAIKLADLGLSRRIGEVTSNNQSGLFGVLAYIDPQKFKVNGEKDHSIKSDIYSIGILLWEISSGQPPFCNEPHDECLAINILRGHRENPIPNTPEDYVKIYSDCWNNEPNDRPTINQVIDKLNSITLTNDVIHEQQNIEVPENISDNNSQIISLENNYSEIINEIVILVGNIELESKRQLILNYLNNRKLTSQEIYDWMLRNQDDSNYSNSIFLLGLFYQLGIGINVDARRALELYQNAAILRNIYGIFNLGVCYDKGIGTSIDKLRAFELYQEAAANAANSENSYVICGFGHCYRDVNKREAFKLYQKAANLGNAHGMHSLGICYQYGIGTSIDKYMAFKLYKEAADLGNDSAQFILASMYENGDGTIKHISQAIYWYEKAAMQGHSSAQYKLNELRRNNYV